jgi:PRTRC genetic system protein A
MICYKLGGKVINGDEENSLYTYRVASNGVFLEAERPELKVCVQLGTAEIRGLGEPLHEAIDFRLPRVPVEVVKDFLSQAMEFAEISLEVAGWYVYDKYLWNPKGGTRWFLHIPQQVQRRATCQPLPDQPAYDHTMIEIHSHHSMLAQFSGQDDRDETGFRIYAVIGELSHQPKICTRVGIYGYHWEIPSEWIFELPEELQDARN